MKRNYIADLKEKIDESVEVYGWVNSRRDHGKIIFIDLRDSTGLLQVVITPKNEKVYQFANSLTTEDVIKITGKIGKRPDANVNKDLDSGTIELLASNIELIGKAKELPLPIEGDGYNIDESVRLRYRYLDLRRERLQKNLRIRHQITSATRDFLDQEQFVEIETPYLSKTTPEGARDFLVPSRLQKKQILCLSSITTTVQTASDDRRY